MERCPPGTPAGTVRETAANGRPVDSAAVRYDHFGATSCVGLSPNLWIRGNVAALNGGVS